MSTSLGEAEWLITVITVITVGYSNKINVFLISNHLKLNSFKQVMHRFGARVATGLTMALETMIV